jgi:hypothetical protein
MATPADEFIEFAQEKIGKALLAKVSFRFESIDDESTVLGDGRHHRGRLPADQAALEFSLRQINVPGGNFTQAASQRHQDTINAVCSANRLD